MHEIGNAFEIERVLFQDRNFEGSGADWLKSTNPLIDHSGYSVVSPHKVFMDSKTIWFYSFRKRGIDTVLARW